MTAWETVVVGAGAGGSIVAARLSEDPAHRVLLLDAGPDFPRNPPDDVLHLHLGSGVLTHDWEYRDPDTMGALPRGKIVGGSTAVNATFALRGQPPDYDAWAAQGLGGWSYADCLPYFNRLEADEDFGDQPHHGREGPIHIRRDHPEGLEADFLAAALEAGHERVEDQNQPGRVGAGPLPRNIRDGVRQSTLMTYLAEARGRGNLEIRGEALVDRLSWRDGAVAGVVLDSGEEIAARRVVLAAGAYGTPALLMRSGIGEPTALARLGIECRLDLPGVGRHLLDHPLTLLIFQAAAARPQGPLRLGPVVKIRTKPELDMDDAKFTLAPGDLFNLPGLWGAIVEVDVVDSVGELTVESADPADPPVIRHHFLSDPRDLARMVAACRQAVAVLRTLPEDLAVEFLFPDASILDDQEALEAHLVEYRSSGYHPAGTCRMGPAGDPLRVTDERCRVPGIEGLWIADASVMPNLPRANTNLPTMMIGERVADFIRSAAPTAG